MKAKLITILLICEVIIITAQTTPKLISTKVLKSNIKWINMSFIKNDIFILGQDKNKMVTYSNSKGMVKTITAPIKKNQARLQNEKITEQIEYDRMNFYDINGKKIKSVAFPGDINKLNIAIHKNQDTEELYYEYGSRTRTSTEGGIIRQSDKKIIMKYNEGVFPFQIMTTFCFKKDYYIFNSATDYDITFYDYNKNILKTLRHPTFKPIPYNKEELNSLYPTILEKVNGRPYYPRVIWKIDVFDTELVVIRVRRKFSKELFVDYFNLKTSELLRTCRIPLTSEEIERDVIANKEGIYVLLDSKGVSYLKQYKSK